MKAKICPKCYSLHIKIRWQSFWFAGFPATYSCLDCGYKSYVFPKIELTKKNVTKLIKLRNKKLKEWNNQNF
ncbi:MAG: hypothetical protein QW041_02175 [Candidatus Pacearchaeota archaeon]